MIRLQQINLMRGGKRLLEEASFVIHQGQKIGLTGANGCGKSTLFALIRGEISADAGDVGIPKNLRIAHMAQEVLALDRPAVEYVLDGDVELRRIQQAIADAEVRHDDNALAIQHAALESHNGYSAKSRAEQLLHGLGFSQDQMQSNVRSFSGGWRVRLNLAQTLMCPSDLLLLDEPTNHLDMDAIIWLEGWLKQYPGMLLLISHDRDFLDGVVDQIAHIERQALTTYRGNYTAFERTRAERLALQQSSYEKQQKQKAHLDDFIRRFRAKATKAKQAQSRLKALDRLEEIAPAHVDSPFTFTLPEPERFFDPLLLIRKGEMGYAGAPILKNVSLGLHPGSCIGLLGQNGAGKSTLMKTLADQLPLLAGDRVEGEHLKIGYFAQHQLESLDLDATPVLHIQRLTKTAREQEIRDFLGGFGFHGDKALEVVKGFSGGEQARLALAIVAWQKPNLLLLDEPTNHLDLEMRHALTMALQGYTGAMVLISHDRNLLRNTTDELYLVSDGKMEPFDDDLDAYATWLSQQRRGVSLRDTSDQVTADSGAGSSARDRKEQKRLEAALRAKLRPFRQRVEKLEQALEQCHASLVELEQSLHDPSLYTDDGREQLKTLLARQMLLKQQSQQLEDEWMEACEALEMAESQVS
ncbi:ATP-binding cassette domain-containing protein [Kistimonas scapharcae]|uniref:ATP-binding cassette domain-containing protein n=1 Tax=Kistimonas scapharcae TaxID=1036133 RepID=A0ABP8V1F1_9GAMM